ncbi:zinc ribbon domain-containing protein [Paenibacillus guangzhouensis]|uniref:zinc ribbon domain-containing protein n=1 Tax=Paenibacillus guangzhouensis TaxID=1473112 RepID=UPI0012668FC2|nr:zinc ribbon domain-containing protein [Paenibacillus guangzhouensis]
MIECPWCHEEVTIHHGRCPACKRKLHEISEDDFEELHDPMLTDDEEECEELSIADMIEERFTCVKCQCTACNTKEVAMTGSGLSKMFDIQHHHYLFVSCLECGFVEIYDPDVLAGHKTGKLGTIMDVLFGG